MRTAGVMIKRTGYWYAALAGSSDSRKQFFFRYNAGFAESPIYDDAYISLNIAPRYRFNDHFSLDIDVIAWGNSLKHMQFNPKKLPLALDVKIPLFDLWRHNDLMYQQQNAYPVITM